MIFVNTDPLAFGMAGLALMLALISLLIVVYYVRKLALSTAAMAEAFRAVLDTYVFTSDFDFSDDFDGAEEDDEDDDGDGRDADDDDDDDAPLPPGDDPNATAKLRSFASAELSEAEEEAALAVVLWRSDTAFDALM